MAKSLFSKADPYHAANGQFDFGPGGPQQKAPQGKRGRPGSVGGRVTELQTATQHGLTGRDKANLIGSLGGDLAADMATRFGMKALTEGGMEIGSLFGPEGTVLGGAAGYAAGKAINWGAPVLAGIVGSYLGGKVANSLYDLRQRVAGTQLASMQSKYGGSLTPRQVAGEAGAQVVGSAGYLAGEKALGSEKIGGKVGQAIGALLGHPGIGEVAGETLGASAAAWPADYSGYRLGQAAYDASGAKDQGQFATKDVNVARRAIRGALKTPVVKAADQPKRFQLLDTHSQFDGSFDSLRRTAPPFLFGQKAWAQVKGTPFGRYLQQKLDDAAEAMDEAEQQEPMPPEPGMFGGPSPSFDQAHSTFHNQGQPQPQEGAPPSGDTGGGEDMEDMGKGFTFRASDDMNARTINSGDTGGVPANVRFLRRLMDADTANRRAQIRRVLKQPRVENMQPRPGEDERQYRARANSLFQQGVDEVPARLYKVSLRRPVSAPAENTEAFEVQAAIEKVLNTEDNLKKGLVYGWAYVAEEGGKTLLDHDKDWTDEDELVKGAHRFIKHRTGGVLHDEKGHNIGHIVESVVFTKDLQKALGIDLGKVGWLIGYQISDPRVRVLVQKGLLKAFSIHGAGRRTPMEPNDGR